MKVFTGYAVDIDTTLISGIVNTSLDNQYEEAVNADDGRPDPVFAAIMSGKPMFSFTTHDIATVLGLFTTLPVVAIGTSLTAFFREIADGGLRETTGTKAVATGGIVVLRRINAPHNQEATADIDVYATSADLTHPFTWSNTQALAGAPDSDVKFTGGGVVIGGVTHDPQGWTLDTNAEEILHSASGLPFPSFAAIQNWRPTITVNSFDVEKITTLGSAATVTGSLFYLRKLTQGGTRTPDLTAEHIELTVAEAMARIDRVDGNHGSEAEAPVMITAVNDGTNATVAVDTAHAHP